MTSSNSNHHTKHQINHSKELEQPYIHKMPRIETPPVKYRPLVCPPVPKKQRQSVKSITTAN